MKSRCYDIRINVGRQYVHAWATHKPGMIQMEQPPRYVVQALAQISFIKYQPLSQVYAQSVMSKQQQCRVQKTVEVKLPIIIFYIYIL